MLVTGGLWRLKRGRIYRINAVMPELMQRTMYLGLLVQQINNQEIPAAEKAELIRQLDGLSASEMELLIPYSGGARLADQIREVVSKHRGVDRTTKDKNRVN